MARDIKEIQSYEARMYWSRILDEVRGGMCYRQLGAIAGYFCP